MKPLLLPCVLGLALGSALGFEFPAQAESSGLRTQLANSIQEVPKGAPISRPHRVRDRLSASEAAQKLNLVVSLRLRNYDAFQAVVQSGRTVPADDLEENFLPLKADYDRVAAWLASQGLETTLVDSSHTRLFVRGTVAQISAAFGTTFARVATADGEFSSAVTAPSVPAQMGSAILGVEGLQPHIRLHAPTVQAEALVPDLAHPTRAIPADLLKAYNVPAGLTGAGQTIAVFADAFPLQSDLSTFYQLTGTNEVNPAFTPVSINGGPTGGGSLNEVTLDSEWSTGIAPGASLVVFGAPAGDLGDFETVCTQILNGGTIKILTSSYSSPETDFAPASLASASQLFAQMAAAGITLLHGAGDSGSYGGSVAPEYPPTDPYVTALGGTAMTFDANWDEVSEVAWPNTGGGYSTYFPQPVWQTGPGVAAGTLRCVPDAAAPASLISAGGLINGFIVLDGATNIGIGGDSATGPIWAGLTAMLNQARAAEGLPSIGLLGPKIYPLIGTSAFTDITSGSDGAYSAGPGYDLCTGVGTPNLGALVQDLAYAPTFTLAASPASASVDPGRSAAFNAIAVGTPAPAYQWTLNGSAAIPGASVTNDPVLLITGATAANSGTYTCTATNTAGTAATTATLTVQATSAPARLDNLSARAEDLSGGNILIAGLTVGGSGTEPILLRAVGPGLSIVGVDSGQLPHPVLTVFDNQSIPIESDTGWGNPLAPGSSSDNIDPTPATATLMNNVGAFPLPQGSTDSAMEVQLAPGPYTLEATDANGATGIALAEVYDAGGGGAIRLTNISARADVGAGGDILIGGLTISGDSAETVLLRAVGPGLVYQNFPNNGLLAQPSLAVYQGSTQIYGDTVWGGDPVIASAFPMVGASHLGNGSADCAVLITLPPGGYTVLVSGVGGTSGIGLVEVYEVR